MTNPVADFTADTIVGLNPLTVQFTDTSTNIPTSWTWDFGDNDGSANQNPLHTYTEGGSYNVSLTSSNDDGDSIPEVKLNYIIVVPVPEITHKFVSQIDDDSDPTTIKPKRDWNDDHNKINIPAIFPQAGTFRIPMLVDSYEIPAVKGGVTSLSPYTNDGNVDVAPDPLTGMQTIRLISVSGYNSGSIHRTITEDTGTWEFMWRISQPEGQVQFAFLTVASHYECNREYYDGYSIVHNGAAGTISLTKQTQGACNCWANNQTVLLTTQETGRPDMHKVKVSRDNQGNFEMWYNDVSIGTVQDTDFNTFDTEAITAMSADTYSYTVNLYFESKNGVALVGTNNTSIAPPSVNFTNLDGNSDEEWLLIYEGSISNQDASAIITFNGDNSNSYNSYAHITASNMGNQSWGATTTGVILPMTVWSYQPGEVYFETKIRSKSGKRRKVSSEIDVGSPSGTELHHSIGYWYNIIDNITSLRVAMNAGTFLGTFKLYKMIDLILM